MHTIKHNMKQVPQGLGRYQKMPSNHRAEVPARFAQRFAAQGHGLLDGGFVMRCITCENLCKTQVSGMLAGQ